MSIKVAHNLQEHIALIDPDRQKALCKCGFHGPERDYPYQAREDLMKHLKRMGTLETKEESPDFYEEDELANV